MTIPAPLRPRREPSQLTGAVEFWVSPPQMEKRFMTSTLAAKMGGQKRAFNALPDTEDDDSADSTASTASSVRPLASLSRLAMTDKRVNVAALPKPKTPAPQVPEQRTEELKQLDEIVAILSRQVSRLPLLQLAKPRTHRRCQSIAGEDDVYLVRLADGRRIKVAEGALDSYPDLIEEFDSHRPSDPDAAVIVSSEEGGSDDAYDSIASAVEDDDDIRDFIADDDDEDDAPPRRRTRATGKATRRVAKAAPEPSRRSSRATRHQDAYANEGSAATSDSGLDPSTSEEEPLSATVSTHRTVAAARELMTVIDIDADEVDEGDLKKRHRPVCLVPFMTMYSNKACRSARSAVPSLQTGSSDELRSESEGKATGTPAAATR